MKEEKKKMREEKEKTKKERKTAPIDWSCCRLASLGRLTLLLRLFGSEREKMRTPIDVLCCSCLHTLLCVCMRRRARARAFRPMKYQQQAMQLDDERIEGKRVDRPRSYIERQCVVIVVVALLLYSI